MERILDNKSCYLFGSEYCDLLNWPACEGCPIEKQSHKSDQQKAIRDFDAIMDLVPAEGIAPLFLSETCLMCKDTPPNPRSGYLTTYLVNKEPKSIKTNILGMKSQSHFGSIIPLAISCCNRCKRNFFLVWYSPAVTSLIFALFTLGLLSLKEINRLLIGQNGVLGVLILVLAIIIGFLIGKLIQRSILKKVSRETQLDFWEIPLARKLKVLGWETENQSQGRNLVFTKKKVEFGLYTGGNSKGRAQI